MDGVLAGRVAIVTGSNRNIGRSIALQMAAAGAKVVINGHRDQEAIDAVVDEIRSAGGKAIGCLADVSRREEVFRLVEETVAAFGKVDIAVSNVAVRQRAAFLDIKPEDWDFVINTNLAASFHLAQAVLPCMLEQKWGRIMHIVGGSNFFAYTIERAHSNAAKAGMHGLTRALAREFGPHGITVNTVAPGNIDTERDWSKYPTENREKPPSNIALGRRGTTDEIAATCVFLCSPGGSFISGQAIHINGAQYMF